MFIPQWLKRLVNKIVEVNIKVKRKKTLQILSLIISVICFITTLIVSIIVWNGQIGYME